MLSIQICISQTDDDYDQELKKISTSFNNKDFKSIYTSFDASYQSTNPEADFIKMMGDYFSELGQIASSEFWMEGEAGNCYLLEFDNASMVLILKLSADKKITQFTIDEY